MNINDLQPASALALGYGVKCLAYGAPGSGKTPLMKSAPRPVLCVIEPGMLSMRDAHTIPAYRADTPQRIDEFFQWVKTSAEARNFDTICVDSVTQMAELYLSAELTRNKDGRKAYGEMSRRVMEHLNTLYFMPEKHVYLVAKQTTQEEAGVQKRRPSFPGQDLNVKIPHLYDEILHVGRVPGPQGETPAIRTRESFDVMARDRSGKLAELEPMDLASLFAKAMS